MCHLALPDLDPACGPRAHCAQPHRSFVGCQLTTQYPATPLHPRPRPPPPPPPPMPRDWNGVDSPVKLKLEMPDEFMNEPVFATREGMFKQYGFNLKASNNLALDRVQPDIRSAECKAVKYPRPTEMPQVSVIIIYYNEAMSTLLRNLLGVLNRSPPDLLGEILLVDDNSTLEQLKYLPEHVARLPHSARSKIRMVHRNIHNGIVGARNRGADEAKHDIILFLDSHAEVTPGWLEPLVFRIHEDPTRVVIPDLRPIDLNTLRIPGGSSWPPYKGSFNWRLSFIIVGADPDKDLAPGFENNQHVAPVRSPIMPGGLFAMVSFALSAIIVVCARAWRGFGHFRLRPGWGWLIAPGGERGHRVSLKSRPIIKMFVSSGVRL